MTKFQQIRFLINEPRYEGRMLIAKMALAGIALWTFYEVVASFIRGVAF